MFSGIKLQRWPLAYRGQAGSEFQFNILNMKEVAESIPPFANPE
jgi:hypothetical protein